MRIENYVDLSGRSGCSGLFFVSGSFGLIDGDVGYTRGDEDGKTVFTYENDKVRVRAEFEMVGDVCVRRGTLENISGEPIEINDFLSRFTLDGSDYDVYTQYSAWVHESVGEWQHLTTQIRAEACGMRGCDGATPMLAMHNRFTGRNTVFHLVPNAQWQMIARKYPVMDKEIVVVEMGFSNTGLRFPLAEGECISLPDVIFYPAQNRTDLDAYKLHRYYIQKYPRTKLPVFYNSWMHCFDHLDIEDLKAQADCAKEMGFEGFMIDAGWFGNGEAWADCVGDWEENLVSGPCGRLSEVSERVRENGMIFGLWFEPERATKTSQSVSAHPEYYILPTRGDALLDFANPDAVEFIYEKVASQIEKYHIGWVKFDFNATIPVDPSGCAFYHYLKGQKVFVDKLKARFPDLYITNCASGGYRMDLHQPTFTDSLWISDNHSPVRGLDILRGTLKRLPTSFIERWNVQQYAEGFPRYGVVGKVGVLFNCNNGTWDSITTVDPTFAENFFIGGPMGFSCDLVALPEEYKNRWVSAIAQYKEDRDFFRTATAHILVDADAICVIEYASEKFERVVLQLFTKLVNAESLTVYPVLDTTAEYSYGEKCMKGADLASDGISFAGLREFSCVRLDLFGTK